MVLKKRRERFLKKELPALFVTMDKLGLSLQDLQEYEKNRNKKEIENEVKPQEEQ